MCHTAPAFIMIRGWYRAAVDHAPPPAQVTLERITKDCVELYSYIPPSGDNISTAVTPDHVDESIPMEKEIKWTVRRLWGNRSGPPPPPPPPDAHRESPGVAAGALNIRINGDNGGVRRDMGKRSGQEGNKTTGRNGTERRWTMPHRPLESPSIGSQRNAWNSTVSYRPRGRTSPCL